MSAKKSCILFILCCVSLSVSAQNDSTGQRNNWWVTVGGNTGLSSNTSFLTGLNLGFHYFPDSRHGLKVNSYISGGWDKVLKKPESNKLRYIQNISAQYAYMHHISRSTAIILSSGLSFGAAQWRGEYLYYDKEKSNGFLSFAGYIYKMDYYNYVGIPIDFTILWATPRHGFSIDVFANFHKHSDYGLRLNYNIGKIRAKSL